MINITPPPAALAVRGSGAGRDPRQGSDDRSQRLQMEAGLDSGPVFLKQETPISATETAGQLTTRLAALSAGARRRPRPDRASASSPRRRTEAA
jgi:hypothetical protein